MKPRNYAQIRQLIRDMADSEREEREARRLLEEVLAHPRVEVTDAEAASLREDFADAFVRATRIEVFLDGANGPKVHAPSRVTPEEILAALPKGWTIHDDDWSNGVGIGSGRVSYPLSRA
jgi:hypothetical protein